MRRTTALALMIPAALWCACSSTTTTSGDAGPGAADSGSETSTDAGTDSANASDGSGNVTLTLEDYLSWCSVTVNGGTPTTTGTQTLSFPAGTVVNLAGDKASATFVFGYWVGTAGDVGAGHDTNKTTTVVMAGNKTVQACCPFASSPSTPCPPP